MKVLLAEYPELEKTLEEYRHFCKIDELRMKVIRVIEMERLYQVVSENLRQKGMNEKSIKSWIDNWLKDWIEGFVKGFTESLQQVLLKILRREFPEHYTEELVSRIQKVQDVSLLEEWLDTVWDAETFEELEKKMG